ncbi:unnamed protein product [Rotaria magnacalcarata]|uniref:Uncharacterized protein n=1 Tax=Rotaria magnacalcarata TaxID=392030 RepID=A0A819W092_9BILA|nr:unnamed protein product [Rotaria magnacalcarata]
MLASSSSNVHSRLSVPEPETNPFSFHPAWETNRIWTTTQYITPISNIPTEFRDRQDSAIIHNTLGFHERQLGPEPDRTALINNQIEHDELPLRAICGPPPSPLDCIPAQRWREPRNDSPLSIDITDPVSSDSPAKYTKPLINEDLLNQLKTISQQLGDLHRSRLSDREEISSLKKELNEIKTTKPVDLSSKAEKSGIVKGQSSRRSSTGARSDSSTQFYIERGTTSSAIELNRTDSFGMPRIPRLTGAIPKVRKDYLPKEYKTIPTVRRDSLTKEEKIPKIRRESISGEDIKSSPKTDKKPKSPEKKKDSSVKKNKKKEDKDTTVEEETDIESNVELRVTDSIGERKAKSRAKKQIKKDIQKMVREERKDQLAQKRLSTSKIDDSFEATEPKHGRKSKSHKELFKELSVHIDRVVVETVEAAEPHKVESENEIYTDNEALAFMDLEIPPEYDPLDLGDENREYHIFGDSNSVILSEFVKNETEEKVVKHGEGGQRLKATSARVLRFVKDLVYTGSRIKIIIVGGHCDVTYLNVNVMYAEPNIRRVSIQINSIKTRLEQALHEIGKTYVGIIWVIPWLSDFLRYNSPYRNNEITYDMSNDHHVVEFREAIRLNETLSLLNYGYMRSVPRYKRSVSIDLQSINDVTRRIPSRVVQIYSIIELWLLFKFFKFYIIPYEES